MDNVIWKPVVGYEGVYEVSNTGLVRRVYSKTYPYPRLLKQSTRRGYLSVDLSKNGKSKTYTVHRLVADAFLPNPNKYEQVNHIDENKANNSVENLEWCTCSYNIRHSLNLHPDRIQRIMEHLPKGRPKGEPQIYHQRVAIVDDEWKVISIFKNAVSASTELNIKSDYITRVCNRNRKREFRYKTDGKIFIFLED
jgi:hypothetical protein